MAEYNKDNICDIHRKSRNWLLMQNQGRLEILTGKKHAVLVVFGVILQVINSYIPMQLSRDDQ